MKNSPSVKPTAKQKMNKNNRILLIFVCIFLSLVLLFGAVFGAITFINDANAAVRLGGITMDEGAVKVFASYYKVLHLTALKSSGYPEARDTEQFWESKHENGKTQGEIYLTSLKNYISGIMAGANLVRNERQLTSDEKAVIKNKTEAFISYYGSEEEFNRLAEEFGFDYGDFVRAMEISYTSAIAFNMIYGYRGANLKLGTAEALASCEKYLNTYSRVKLLFLCEDRIVEEGADGEYVERDLTDGEKEARENMAKELRDAISAKEAGENGAITEIMFDNYLEKSDGDPDMHKSGYYFHANAEQTAKFAESQPEAVEAALEMEIGEYREAETSIGKCFIYKCEPAVRANEDDENPFFSDFYADAARYLYTEAVEILASEASFRDKYSEIDLLSIPENNRLFVTDWN